MHTRLTYRSRLFCSLSSTMKTPISGQFVFSRFDVGTFFGLDTIVIVTIRNYGTVNCGHLNGSYTILWTQN